jgi:hypothetical protein
MTPRLAAGSRSCILHDAPPAAEARPVLLVSKK